MKTLYLVTFTIIVTFKDYVKYKYVMQIYPTVIPAKTLFSLS